MTVTERGEDPPTLAVRAHHATAEPQSIASTPMTSVTEPATDQQPDIHTTAGKLADLRKRAAETLHPVGEAAVEKVHAKGKLTARERIYALLD